MGPVLKNPLSIPETFIDIMDISKTLPERIRELSASVDSDPASKALDQIKGQLLQSIQDGEEAMRPRNANKLSSWWSKPVSSLRFPPKISIIPKKRGPVPMKLPPG